MDPEIFAFLDVNVLLHYPPPDQIDWRSLCKAYRVNLVIYPTLLTELGMNKTFNSVKVLKKRATERERWLDNKLTSIESPIRPNVYLYEFNTDAEHLLTELQLDPRLVDNRIISSAVAFARQGHRTCVITQDRGLRLKLKGFDLPCIVLSDEFKLASEPDPDKIAAQAALKELSDLKNRQPRLSLKSDRGSSCIPLRRRPPMDDKFSYIEDEMRKIGDARPARWDADIARIASISWPVDDRYWQQYQDASRRYLHREWEWKEKYLGGTAIKFFVENLGSAAATNVLVAIQFPKKLTLLAQRDIKKPPKRLPPASEFLSFQPFGPEVDISPILPGYLNQTENGPRITDNNQVTFYLSRVSHFATEKLPTLVLWVDRDDIANFGADVTLLCDEIGKPERGAVRFAVQEDEA